MFIFHQLYCFNVQLLGFPEFMLLKLLISHFYTWIRIFSIQNYYVSGLNWICINKECIIISIMVKPRGMASITDLIDLVDEVN